MKKLSAHNRKNNSEQVSNFYNWSRDYWIEKSTSSSGESSSMLSFGLWEGFDIEFYDAQIALHDLCMSYFENLPALSQGLEIGCGIGGNVIRLAKKRTDLRITGLDISKSQIDLARTKSISIPDINVKFIEGSSMNIPCNNQFFDFSFCIESSFHYESINLFAKENARILKENGTTLIADITCENSDLIKLKHGNHFRSINEITHALENAGFEITNINRIGKNVFTPLYNYIAKFKERTLLQRYWTKVLRNYSELSEQGVMGYDIIFAKKRISD